MYHIRDSGLASFILVLSVALGVGCGGSGGSKEDDKGDEVVAGSQERRRSLSQHGVTWVFDRDYPVGRFVNGDWWVAPLEVGGEVVVESVVPGRSGTGSSTRNGSMLNPVGGYSQSYDGRSTAFSEAETQGFPTVMREWDSLMSSVSRPEDDELRADVHGRETRVNRVALLTMAVLTCVPHEARDLDLKFRPPYSRPFGSTTREMVTYDSRAIRWDRLPSLTPVAGYPEVSQASRAFERVCPMHVGGAASEGVRPLLNTGGYYRGQHHAESQVALLLVCDPNIVGDKEKLVINFVQFGIDTVYALRSYSPLDPFRNDRVLSKWPALFSSLMLDDATLASIPEDAELKTEETARGECWTGADVVWIKGGHAPSHETIHPSNWCQYSQGGSGYKAESYRRQTHSWTWVGTALAARIMGARGLWGHDAFFDYVDRWMLFDAREEGGMDYSGDDGLYDELNAIVSTNPCGDVPALVRLGYRQGSVPGDAWTTEMWRAYR